MLDRQVESLLRAAEMLHTLAVVRPEQPQAVGTDAR